MVDLKLQNILTLKKNAEQTELLLLNFLTSKWRLLHDEIETMNRIYQSYSIEIEDSFSKFVDREQKNSLFYVLQEIDKQRSLKQRQISEVHFQINRQTRLLNERKQEIRTLEKFLNKQKKSPFHSTATGSVFFSDKPAFGAFGIKLF